MTARLGLGPRWTGLLAAGGLPADPLLRAAAIGAVALALVTALVMLQVLLLSTWTAREARRRAAFNRAWRQQLGAASIDEAHAPALPAPAGRERLWWLMLWNRLQRQLRGGARARLNRLPRAFGFDRYALKLARRGNVRRRLIALETLRHLGDARHWDALRPAVRARNPFVALAAAHALVAIDPARAMRTLLPLAVARADWSVPRVRALCQQAGRAAVTGPLLRALDEGEPRTLARLVPLLGFAEPEHAAPWARGCLAHDPDPQHRQVAVRTLGELRDPRDRAALVRALADADAAVRLATLDAFAPQADARDLDALLPLLADRSWWVRQRAAAALAALPQLGTAQLRALLPRVDDRYGREALERALDAARVP